MVHQQFSTVSQPIQAVSRMLAHERAYGVVSQLSRSQQVSRQTLYSWKGKGQRALEVAFAPSKPEETIPLERAVLTLLVEGHASYRGIQRCLAVLLGREVSLGTITAIVQEAGERAQRWLEQQVSEPGRVVALDEQYSSKRGEAYLNIVDVHSTQVWASWPAVAVDGESWTLALWYLQEQGVNTKASVSDGGRAIADALRTTKALETHQRDVWHILHLASQVQARLERVVQKEEARSLVSQHQEQHRASTGKQATGRPAKTTASQQEEMLSQLHRVHEGVTYLFAQLRCLLEIVVLSQENKPRLLSAVTRRSEVETVLDLLEDLVQCAPAAVRTEVEKVSKQVRLALPALLFFAQELEARQQAAIAGLGDEAVGLIGWAWQRRAILGKEPRQLLEALDPVWREQASPLLEAWQRAVRASSAVENWHSIVRPHLAVHRSLSAGLLAVLAVWHNHRVAPRGVYEGLSPLQRSGIVEKTTDWLVALGYPPSPATRPLTILKDEEAMVA
jgi:Transposase, Mutator family